MIRHYLNTIGTIILDHQTGEPLGLIKDVILDTDKGKIEGFWVKPASLMADYLILDIKDILEWKKNIYVKSEEVFAEPGEIIKIEALLEKNVLLIDNAAQNEEGEYLGDVFNYDFEDKTYLIKTIYTQKSFFGFISYQKRIFDRKRILKITSEYVLVNNKENKVTDPPVEVEEGIAGPVLG